MYVCVCVLLTTELDFRSQQDNDQLQWAVSTQRHALTREETHRHSHRC